MLIDFTKVKGTIKTVMTHNENTIAKSLQDETH